MSVVYVKSQIFAKNSIMLTDCMPVESLNCDSLRVSGMYWGVPQVVNGRFAGYYPRMATTKPHIDAVRLIRLYDYKTFTTYYLPVADSADTSVWTNLCNGCCGQNPSLPNYVLPVPIVEYYPCPVPSGGTNNYNYQALYPADPNNLNIALAGSFNGNYGTPTPPDGGFANAAAVLAWVQANWSAYGTWSNVTSGANTFLQLASTTVVSAGMALGLIPANYCLPFPIGADQNVDTIVIGGNVITLPDAIVLSKNNPQALYTALNAYLGQTNGLTIYDGAGAPLVPSLQYNGDLLPTDLRLGTNVVASFGAGACANHTFVFPVPALGGLHYHVTQANFNGVAATPDITGQSFVSAAAMLTWLNANWSAYGTWSLPDATHLKLVSSTTTVVTNLTITAS